ncbi:EamA family transporter [Trinickia fusca]|nr:EamA family transporter [Trinickia fusca]
MCCVQFGAALSVPAMQSVGLFRGAALRLAFAALILLLWRRPPLATLRREPALILLGMAMAGMLLGFYAALRTLPQGLVVAISLLGPLLLAWRQDRRGWKWPVLALLGILALSRHGELWVIDAAGLAWAAVSAGCWAAYIVLLRRAGEACRGEEGVALALLVAALSAAPWAWLEGGAWPDWTILLQVAGLSLLMPALPYLLEQAALRRMPSASFGMLMSVEPAIAVLAGAALLGQTPTWSQLAGTALVIAASLGSLAES